MKNLPHEKAAVKPQYELRIQLWSGGTLAATCPSGSLEELRRWQNVLRQCPEVAGSAVIELTDDDGPDRAA
jgi:hypothetical protein